jgi:isopentenyl-diphosphate delta-isomerase
MDDAERPSPQKRAGRDAARIARIGETLRHTAHDSLPAPPKAALSTAAQRRLAAARADPAPVRRDELDTLVEIVDDDDRPLLLMPLDEALLQGLPARMAAAAVFTRQGRLILRKRRDVVPAGAEKWDIYAGPVLAGEAREDAVLRLLASLTGLPGLSATPLDAGPSRLLALFSVRLPAGLYPRHAPQDMLMVDADELAGLTRDVPELLSAELRIVAAVPGLFRP